MKCAILSISILALTVLFPSCSKENSSQSINETETKQTQAVQEMLTKSYPKWKLVGKTELDYSDNSQILYLESENKTKVVYIVIREFDLIEGNTKKWIAYETDNNKIFLKKYCENEQKENENRLAEEMRESNDPRQ